MEEREKRHGAVLVPVPSEAELNQRQFYAYRDHRRGLERAARLLDDYGEVPEAEQLGRSAVMRRSEALTEDAEPYFEDEPDVVSELLQAHGDE